VLHNTQIQYFICERLSTLTNLKLLDVCKKNCSKMHPKKWLQVDYSLIYTKNTTKCILKKNHANYSNYYSQVNLVDIHAGISYLFKLLCFIFILKLILNVL